MSVHEEHISLLHKYMELAGKEAEQIIRIGGTSQPVWHEPDEVPEDENKIYLVRLKTGQPMCSRPINGKWLQTVKKWMEIPI